MLAGAGAVSGAIFVVDALEGPRAQSIEHLRLLELLGVHEGVVVITKADLVSADRLDDATLETLVLLEGSPLADADPIVVDSVSGRGLDTLRQALDALVERIEKGNQAGRAGAGRTRLWVDRAFTAAGAGTVVAGSLTGTALEVGDTIELQPGGGTARIRELHSDHAAVDRADPGNRYAMALSGVARSQVGRGIAVVRPDDWWPTTMVDASVSVLGDLDHELSRRGAHVLHLGSGEWPVRVRVLGSDAIEPGDQGFLRLHLPRPLPLAPGDHYVLRESGRGETMGGGTILEVDPQRRAAVALPSADPQRVISDRGWVSSRDFRRLTGCDRAPDLGDWLVDIDVRVEAERALVARVESAGAVGLALAELSGHDRVLADSLGRDGDHLEVRDDRLVLPGTVLHHPWLDAVAAGGFDPPPPSGIDPAALRSWVADGRLVKVGEVWWSAEAIGEAARRLATELSAHPDGITVAEVRDALDSSRKPTLALLGLFDERGLTRRRDDLRIRGPRLDAVANGHPINT